MTYTDIITQVSKEVNLPFNVVDKTYKSYWRFIRETIKELPLKEDLTEEEFNRLRTNFNIPSLGKLSCSYTRVKCIKEKFNNIKLLREKI